MITTNSSPFNACAHTNYLPAVRLAVVGPTASGKSDFALELIAAWGEESTAEIVSADAFQLYRGMDIGTAKLPVAQRHGIVHHQIDVLDLHQEASVAAYQISARADLQKIEAKGGRGVIVGGSGLYVRAVTDALDFPGTDPQVRQKLQERLNCEGAPALWDELSRVDPVSAQQIIPANTRKLVRALEVLAVTGKPFSASLPRYEDLVPTVHIGLRLERNELNQRIACRVERMFASGLLEETRELMKSGLAQSPTAGHAIGYKQAIAVIEGRMSLEQAREDTVVATRKLASRQIKWFRRDPRIIWLDVDTGAYANWSSSAFAKIKSIVEQVECKADGVITNE